MEMNQVTLPVKNMDTAVKFYLTLGFTQIVDTPHYARFSCPKGNSTFSLALDEGDYNNGAVIYFETEKLDSLVDELVQKGVVFEQQPTEQRY
jgi:catechol 2,3-dioxygenase-like lactoylglutathione lyase family enzyme